VTSFRFIAVFSYYRKRNIGKFCAINHTGANSTDTIMLRPVVFVVVVVVVFEVVVEEEDEEEEDEEEEEDDDDDDEVEEVEEDEDDGEDLHVPPDFELRESSIPGAGLGVWSVVRLENGERFGPYMGKHAPRPRDRTHSYQVRRAIEMVNTVVNTKQTKDFIIFLLGTQILTR